VSTPYLIAEMLGQGADALGSLEGCDVLEIGSGGYNASLLAELVGLSGSVTTVDIDPKVTDRAAACLAAGYHGVTVVCADAEHPIEPGRRHDLIIVTAGAWDVAPAWRDQLTDDGVLVVPLRTFGMTRSWALRRRGDRLVSQSRRLCGFVSMQGAGAHEMRYVDIAEVPFSTTQRPAGQPPVVCGGQGLGVNPGDPGAGTARAAGPEAGDGGFGQVEGGGGVAEFDGLNSQRAEDGGAHERVLCLVCQAHGLDVVLLPEFIGSAVYCHPPGQVGKLAGGPEQIRASSAGGAT
jgi:protein-L-isoaspartate O-methyltransferase